MADILIVDTNSDLNVYVTANEGGEGGPCCGPKKAEEPSSSCCSSSTDRGAAPEFVDQIKTDFKGVDFNEWAGQCCPVSIFPDGDEMHVFFCLSGKVD